MNKPRVFVTGSLWSLLIYMLHNDIDDIKRTHYFFVDTGIHKSVRKNFRCHILHTKWEERCHWRFVQFLYIFIPILNRVRWPYLLFSDIWGIDQGWAVQSIIGRSQYSLIEDGAADYVVERFIPKIKRQRLIEALWSKVYRHDYGRNSQCKIIVLTNPTNKEGLREKAIIINISKLWTDASNEKKNFILSMFNLNSEDIASISSRKIVLLTQPLSEDHIFPTEAEKISLYKEMIENYGEKNIVIKTHPREKTDYRSFFPEAVVADKIIPFQLFKLMGIKFDVVVTVCSTAAQSLKDKETVIDFKGSEIDERIVKAYGIVKFDSV